MQRERDGRADVAVATNRIFDPELSGYKYPRDVKFFEFRDQDQDLRMAYMDEEPESVATRKRCSCCTVRTSPARTGSRRSESSSRKDFESSRQTRSASGSRRSLTATSSRSKRSLRTPRALLESLNIDRTHVVGHSMGGMLATRLALMFPERTERLVLVNPIGLEDWKALGVPYRSIDENFAQELTMTPGSIREYERVSYFDGHWKPDYDPLIEILAGWSEDPEYPIVAWNAALTSDMIFTQPVLYEFPLVTARTLLIIGQRDRTAFAGPSVSASVRATLGHYPLLGRAAAQAIQHATLVEIAGVGHLPQIEAFDQYFEALAGFLTSDASQ